VPFHNRRESNQNRWFCWSAKNRSYLDQVGTMLRFTAADLRKAA
jgi:hypothetical protein